MPKNVYNSVVYVGQKTRIKLLHFDCVNACTLLGSHDDCIVLQPSGHCLEHAYRHFA
jgi:hypothetical protein